MKAKLLKNRNGTALIVALLVMGVLMAISLALSALVLRESVVTREFLDAGQSFYAAESASEIGLYGVKNNLPGWEPVDGVAVPISVGENAVAELKVMNKCRAYPCFDGGYDFDGKTSGFVPEAKAFYATLGLNESVTIPLFVMGDDGKPQEITDFNVEFYANFKPDDIKITKNGLNVSDWDVLRWKIVGLNDSIQGKPPMTESISDFTAVSVASDGTFTNPKMPSWFGTNPCVGTGRYTDMIQCQLYTVISETSNCSQMEAREFYLYSFADGERTNEVKHCWPLSRFINEHKLNYLTLTNLINPSVFKKPRESDKQSSIFYRVELFTTKDGVKTATDTVRDFADITADGYSGRSKQSVNVKIKRDSFMPVFNFSLYSTYMEKNAQKTDDGKVHDDTYWYGKK
jgi:hypothetical protein